jgi:transposase-like protein
VRWHAPFNLIHSEAGSFDWIKEYSGMARKRHSAEEIVNKLRDAEVLIANGTTVARVCKQIGVTDQTYYKWRRE